MKDSQIIIGLCFALILIIQFLLHSSQKKSIKEVSDYVEKVQGECDESHEKSDLAHERIDILNGRIETVQEIKNLIEANKRS